MSGFQRERHLLGMRIYTVRDEAHGFLQRVHLQMEITNMRNRPLSGAGIHSMSHSMPSLYHSLLTGTKVFPLVNFIGRFCSLQLYSPFEHSEQSQTENNPPSYLTEAPAGMMVPPAGSRSPNILTPVIPELLDLGALRADRRNCVRTMVFSTEIITRVISPVYRSDNTELTNRWRVTDYGDNGRILMSVLCKFTEWPQKRGKRKNREEEEESGSSQSLPKKRLRV